MRQFAGWCLSVNCPACRALWVMPMAALVQPIGTDKKLADGIEGTARKVRSVMLVE